MASKSGFTGRVSQRRGRNGDRVDVAYRTRRWVPSAAPCALCEVCHARCLHDMDIVRPVPPSPWWWHTVGGWWAAERPRACTCVHVCASHLLGVRQRHLDTCAWRCMLWVHIGTSLRHAAAHSRTAHSVNTLSVVMRVRARAVPARTVTCLHCRDLFPRALCTPSASVTVSVDGAHSTVSAGRPST